jgi:hypothetical protein
MRSTVWERSVWVVVMMVAACGDAPPQGDALRLPAAPSEWLVVESSCGYRFRAPGDLRELSVEPLDSCVETFATEDCRLTGDVGWYAPDLEEYASAPEHRSSTVDIDGHAATVVEFRLAEAHDGRAYVAAVHVPGIDPVEPAVDLSLWLDCTSARARNQLEAMFGTIELAPRVAG